MQQLAKGETPGFLSYGRTRLATCPLQVAGVLQEHHKLGHKRKPENVKDHIQKMLASARMIHKHNTTRTGTRAARILAE